MQRRTKQTDSAWIVTRNRNLLCGESCVRVFFLSRSNDRRDMFVWPVVRCEKAQQGKKQEKQGAAVAAAAAWWWLDNRIHSNFFLDTS